MLSEKGGGLNSSVKSISLGQTSQSMQANMGQHFMLLVICPSNKGPSWLVTSIFSFSYNVFWSYSFQNKFQYISHIYFIIHMTNCFNVDQPRKLLFSKELNPVKPELGLYMCICILTLYQTTKF